MKEERGKNWSNILRQESNLRPFTNRANALPTELRRQGLSKRQFSQLFLPLKDAEPLFPADPTAVAGSHPRRFPYLEWCLGHLGCLVNFFLSLLSYYSTLSQECLLHYIYIYCYKNVPVARRHLRHEQRSRYSKLFAQLSSGVNAGKITNQKNRSLLYTLRQDKIHTMNAPDNKTEFNPPN